MVNEGVDSMILAAFLGMAAGLAFFCLTARAFADLDPTDEFIDQLVNGEQPRLPSQITFHNRRDN